MRRFANRTILAVCCASIAAGVFGSALCPVPDRDQTAAPRPKDSVVCTLLNILGWILCLLCSFMLLSNALKTGGDKRS
jgi:hypothetical protein